MYAGLYTVNLNKNSRQTKRLTSAPPAWRLYSKQAIFNPRPNGRLRTSNTGLFCTWGRNVHNHSERVSTPSRCGLPSTRSIGGAYGSRWRIEGVDGAVAMEPFESDASDGKALPRLQHRAAGAHLSVVVLATTFSSCSSWTRSPPQIQHEGASPSA